MAATSTLEPVKLTQAGNFRGSPGKLCWIELSNSSEAPLQMVLCDATTGETPEVMRINVPKTDSKFLCFQPPCPFDAGIRAGTLEAGLVVTAGFID